MLKPPCPCCAYRYLFARRDSQIIENDNDDDDNDDDDNDDNDDKDDYRCNLVNFKVRTSRFCN